MNIRVVMLAGLETVLLATAHRVPCQAAVFRTGYSECANRAIKQRGKWVLCGSHNRLDEVEIVVDNGIESVVD